MQYVRNLLETLIALLSSILPLTISPHSATYIYFSREILYSRNMVAKDGNNIDCIGRSWLTEAFVKLEDNEGMLVNAPLNITGQSVDEVKKRLR